MIVYLTRHGQSIYNVKKLLGGDSGLSDLGVKYSEELFNFFKDTDPDKINLITSNMIRTKLTAKFFPKINYSFSFINEINAGIFEKMSTNHTMINNPEEYNKRKKDKFNYVYPKGESYKMLQKRALQVLDYLKEDKINIIICHNAVLRVIYSYFNNIPNDQMPHLDIPLHTLFYLKTNGRTIIEKNKIKIIKRLG
tara:strand:- start:1293 stop:1877 length:585 start_codon:yes stop_codon:yes gene_type:complete